jgi:D-glycero-D-manno-heptose 1,7-bisphosphate phosphatase
MNRSARAYPPRICASRERIDPATSPLLCRSAEAPELRLAVDACFIVSNQARSGKGEISPAEVLRRFRWVNDRLGGPFTDWRLCPHVEDEGCTCRKPRPGMFLDLAASHGIDLAASAHVGDADKDRVVAAAAGIPNFHWAWEFFRPDSSSR